MENYWLVILITFLGFVALAALLLIPVWKFLVKEEAAGDQFTRQVAEMEQGQDETAKVSGTAVDSSLSESGDVS